ncbi:MAG: BREX-2 system phosphatase PglZ [Acidimicrobiales bacterium]
MSPETSTVAHPGETDGSAGRARAATPELLRQLVRQLRDGMKDRSHPEPFVVGVKAAPVWNLGDLDDPLVGTIHIEPCPSPLAARRAIADFAPDSDLPATLVLLTDVSEADLGADLLGRFVRPKLYSLSPWDAVRQRFGAKSLDTAFGEARYAWMVDPLLDVPVESLPAGAVVLSAEAALRAVTSAVLGATGTSLERILLSTTHRSFTSTIEAADPTVVATLCSTLGDLLGPAGQLVTGAIAQGRGEQCVPAGLAARTVVGGVSGSRAQARIEDLTGSTNVTEASLAAWARAAERAFDDLAANEDDRSASVYDIDHVGSALVVDWQAISSDASDKLSVSFEARLDHLADLLHEALEGTGPVDIDSMRVAVHRVVTHRIAGTEPGRPRAQRAQLAARLVSWLRDPVSAQHGTGASPARATQLTLTESIDAYLADGAWVDAARRRVGEGDDTPQRFAAALQRISEAAHRRRADGNRAFADALARWTTDGTAAELPTGEVLAVESVLGDLVAPLAQQVPVLLVVLDGCGLAPFLELADQFAQFGLKEIGRNDRRRVALAALPTVTEASRTSLLTGQLRTGAAADESRELPIHPKLTKLGGPPPLVVHHRPDLVSGVGQGLPQHVSLGLSENGPRVVAAVVNTIDDELSRGTFNPEYRIEHLGPLPALLRAAAAAGRIVVVTADHGHVLGVGLDGKGDVSRSGDGGDRWRIADRAPTDDEVLLRGPRVLLGDERGVLAPWHDDLRYSAKHGGYHGGATPDESIVPLSVFAPAGIDLPKGWDLLSIAKPAWWDLHVDMAEEPAPVRPARRPKAKGGEKKAGQAALFEPPTTPAETPKASTPGSGDSAPPWVDEVLASGVYSLQLGSIGRGKPDPDKVRSTIAVLQRRGGVANYAVIAQATGMPAGRVAGFLAIVARILNVDGFGVLTVDSAAQEARLDEQLLRSQFLEGGS